MVIGREGEAGGLEGVSGDMNSWVVAEVVIVAPSLSSDAKERENGSL